MAQWYRQALVKALNREIDWDSDAFKLTLHGSLYVPNLDTHVYAVSLSSELVTGGNYTAGGFTVVMQAPVFTAANSWATTRANSTAYALDDVVRPATGNGYLYVAAVAGTSGATIPTYPTAVGTTVVDGGVTWANVGKGIIVLDGTDVTQAAFTAGPFRYGVISDITSGAGGNTPLIALIDFVAPQTGGGGTFNLAWSASGILQLFLP